MPEAPEVKWVFMVAVIGGLFMMKKREPGISSRTPQIPSGPAIATRFSDQKERDARVSIANHHDPNSPYTMGADGEMINMASVGKPRKGGGHNAYNPVVPVNSSGMSREDERKLYMASQAKQEV